MGLDRRIGIVGQALLPMALGTALVTGIASWVIYQHSAERYSSGSLRELRSTSDERSRAETQLFATARSNLHHLVRLVEYHTADRSSLIQQLQPQGDGSLGLNQDGVVAWVAPQAVDDDLAPVLAIMEEYGPAWGEDLPAVGVACPSRWLVGYGEPLVELVDALLPSDPVLLPQEMALLQQPGDALRWSAPYIEPATERWMITAIQPMMAAGHRAAAMHHVPLAGMLDRVAANDRDGVATAVWGSDGSVVIGSESLAAQLQAQVAASGPESELLALADGGQVAISRLAPTGLIVATVYPADVILGPARAAAAMALVVGVIALLAQILVATIVLKYRVRRPIHRLQAQITLLGAGQRDLRADVRGPQEIRTLARAFNDMADAVSRTEDDLRNAYERLEQRERLYFALFEHAGDAVFLLSEGAIVDCNRRAEVDFAVSRERLIGMKFLDLTQAEQPSGESSEAVFLRHCEQDGLGELFAWQVLGPAGKSFDAEVLIGRVDVPDRALWLVSVRDVTDRNQLEDQVRQAQKMESLGQLAGGIAHDFNNMLGAMVGTSELLSRRLKGEDAKLAERILHTGERAAELTNKLLAFARRGRNLSTPVDVHRLVEDTMAMLERSIDRRIKLESHLDAEHRMVVADGASLQNALLNLGLNARDAMPEGGVLCYRTADCVLEEELTVDVSAPLLPGRYVEILVIDDGVGMPDAVRERAFDPFFTTKPVGKGTGLGLAAVYRTVHDHAGAIAVDTAEGKGATFRMLLPATDEIHSAATRAERTVQSGSGCILVVDDEELLRTTAREMLSALGYTVIEACNGAEGVTQYRAHRTDIDAVMLDMEMPVMRGIDCIRELKAMDPGVQAVLCSGFARDADSKELREAGFRGFLQKPYRLYDLGRVIAEAVVERQGE
ncbi:MAG: response regulator [Planctomycetota bacterium]|jgi:PAS domain S-box-containing protein|nr:response regulator [Planctomycetota bacterium]